MALGLNPFANRLRLNVAAFTEANAQALRTMANRYGVRYLIADERNGYAADLGRLASFGRVVYRAPGAAVLELDRPLK